MMKMLLTLLLLSILGYGYVDKEAFLHTIEKLPPLSNKTLCKKLHLLKTDPKAPSTMVEDEFLLWNSDSNEIAIDFSKTTLKQIVKLTSKYGVIFYDDGFSQYGLLFNPKGVLEEVVLLAYRKGNSEWQAERYTTLHRANALFLVNEQFRGTEWIIPQTKGEMIVTENMLFLIDVKEPQHFHIQKSSYKQLYQQEDKRLNQHYQKLLKHLSKQKRDALREIQRAWIDYTQKKCRTLLKETIAQEEYSVHKQTYQWHCFYEETQQRNQALQSLLEYTTLYE